MFLVFVCLRHIQLLIYVYFGNIECHRYLVCACHEALTFKREIHPRHARLPFRGERSMCREETLSFWFQSSKEGPGSKRNILHHCTVCSFFLLPLYRACRVSFLTQGLKDFSCKPIPPPFLNTEGMFSEAEFHSGDSPCGNIQRPRTRPLPA